MALLFACPDGFTPAGRAEAMSTIRWACLGLLVSFCVGASSACAAAPIPEEVQPTCVVFRVVFVKGKAGFSRSLKAREIKWQVVKAAEGQGLGRPFAGVFASPAQKAKLARTLTGMEKNGL